MLKSILLLFCILSGVHVYGQQFRVVDTIRDRTPLFQLEIDDFGNRYYSFARVRDWDTVKINNQIYSPRSLYSTSLTVVINEFGDSLYTIHPGGDHISLIDDQLISFLSFGDDSIEINTVPYYNYSENADGFNLLIGTYDFNGNRLDSEHWKTTSKSRYTITNSTSRNSRLGIAGDINTDTIRVGDSIVIVGGNFHNSFYGVLNEENEILWANTISGIGHEMVGEISMDSEENLVVVGHSEIFNVFSCGDTLFNTSASFINTFAFVITVDKNGNCLTQKEFISDFGGSYTRDVIHLSDDDFIVLVDCNSCDRIEIDEVNMESKFGQDDSFLFKFNSDAEAINGFRLEGSPGTRYIGYIVSDKHDNIWLAGSCQCDTLSIGTEVLIKSSNESSIIFLAKLNPDLLPISLKKLSSRQRGLFKTTDGDEIYIMFQSDDKTRILYELVDSISFVNSHINEQKSDLVIYPTVLQSGEKLRVETKSDLLSIKNIRLEVYSSNGILSFSKDDAFQFGSATIDTNGLNSGLYLMLIHLPDGQVISGKFILH